MPSFERFLESLGLHPREIIPGRWMRCPTENHPRKRNGSFKLAEDGQIGWAMDFAIHTEPVIWRPERYDAPNVDRRALTRRRIKERRALIMAIHSARAFYESCELLRKSHPYLEAKGLSMEGCFGLKRDPKSGALVVPMLIEGELASVQAIAADGDKRFWPGARTKGAQYRIDRPHAPLTVLCEGLATGLTLFSAVPTARVVVAFNAGNLAPVASTIGHGLHVVAADNDHATARRIGVNPGVKAATEAADVLGCGVAVPECSGTDWNDYFGERLVLLREAERGKRRAKSSAQIVQEVNAEIRAAVMRQARWRSV